MKSNNKQTNKIFSILGLIAVAAILSISLYFIKTAEYGNWVPTEGILINMQQTYNRGGKHHVGGGSGYILYYTYVVDGKNYQGMDSFSGNLPREHFVGEEIEVWYNPADCSQSMYSKPGPGLWPYVPFIFAFLISLFVLGGGFNRKEHTLR